MASERSRVTVLLWLWLLMGLGCGARPKSAAIETHRETATSLHPGARYALRATGVLDAGYGRAIETMVHGELEVFEAANGGARLGLALSHAQLRLIFGPVQRPPVVEQLGQRTTLAVDHHGRLVYREPWSGPPWPSSLQSELSGSLGRAWSAPAAPSGREVFDVAESWLSVLFGVPRESMHVRAKRRRWESVQDGVARRDSQIDLEANTDGGTKVATLGHVRASVRSTTYAQDALRRRSAGELTVRLGAAVPNTSEQRATALTLSFELCTSPAEGSLEDVGCDDQSVPLPSTLDPKPVRPSLRANDYRGSQCAPRIATLQAQMLRAAPHAGGSLLDGIQLSRAPHVDSANLLQGVGPVLEVTERVRLDGRDLGVFEGGGRERLLRELDTIARNGALLRPDQVGQPVIYVLADAELPVAMLEPWLRAVVSSYELRLVVRVDAPAFGPLIPGEAPDWLAQKVSELQKERGEQWSYRVGELGHDAFGACAPLMALSGRLALTGRKFELLAAQLGPALLACNCGGADVDALQAWALLSFLPQSLDARWLSLNHPLPPLPVGAKVAVLAEQLAGSQRLRQPSH